jgi:hypothetical protein
MQTNCGIDVIDSNGVCDSRNGMSVCRHHSPMASLPEQECRDVRGSSRSVTFRPASGTQPYGSAILTYFNVELSGAAVGFQSLLVFFCAGDARPRGR